MKSLLILLCLAIFVSAGWNNETALLKGPRVTVKSGKGSARLADMSQKQPITMMVTKKISTRWIVTVPAKGTFTLTRDGKPFKSVAMEKGKRTLKLYLEPGTYSATSTSGGTIKLLKYKKVKLVAVSPADGGIPVSVSNGRHAYTYFKVGGKVSPQLKLTGPTTAKIFVRIPAGKGNKVDVTVSEGSKVITHRIETVQQSKKLAIVDPKLGIKGSITTPKPGEKVVPTGTPLTDAVVIDFTVPEGVHTYTVSLAGAEGVTKFYRTAVSKKKGTEASKKKKKPAKKVDKKK